MSRKKMPKGTPAVAGPRGLKWRIKNDESIWEPYRGVLGEEIDRFLSEDGVLFIVLHLAPQAPVAFGTFMHTALEEVEE